MRSFLAVAMLALLPVALLPAADLAMLQSSPAVYFWPMSSSFDQYLAQETAAAGMFQVVVDPKLARAVMTDRIDAPFLAAMDELFPKAEEAAKVPPPEAKEAKTDVAETGIHVDTRPKNRPLGRPRGTLFLVDIQTREVLWSTYLDEADKNPNQLHKQARSVVDRLRKHLNPGS
jgi:hypothetical protein